jgi:hypothetical protein
MIGAIYARKSTKQTGAAEDAKCVSRQTNTPERTWTTKGSPPPGGHGFVRFTSREAIFMTARVPTAHPA